LQLTRCIVGPRRGEPCVGSACALRLAPREVASVREGGNAGEGNAEEGNAAAAKYRYPHPRRSTVMRGAPTW